MKYSEYISELRTWFWQSDVAKLVTDKRRSKEYAESCGVRTPKTIDLPSSFVIKPHNGCASRGVELIHNGKNLRGGVNYTIVEELVAGEDEQIPPLNWRYYVFNGVVRMVQVDDGATNTEQRGYYDLDWQPLTTIDSRVSWLDVKSPKCQTKMIEVATKLSDIFPCAVRVDLYATDDGPVFGEFCVTPGLSRRLTADGDQLLGSFVERNENE